VRALLLVAFALLPMPHAAADPPPPERAAVVAIEQGPSVPDYLRAMATNQIAAGLLAAGYELLPAADVSARLTGELAKCRDGACVRRVGEALGVRSLVFVTLEGTGDETVIAMRVHDGRTGLREAEVREVCELCGQAELLVRIGVAASALRVRAHELRREAASAKTAAAPAPARTAIPAGASRSIVPGIVVGLAGALAVGGGLYLMALDGRGTCARGDGPVFPDPDAVIRYPDPSNLDRFVCRDVYETRTSGIAVASVGVAAVAAGVALVVRARRRARAVEIAPRAGGASVGVSWSW
jgi:hypothetical protein